jgi:4-aminobutyrate aminotransferase-like enzyme
VAAAAASAALAEMERLPLRTMVEGIESAVRSTLDVEGVTLRGGGALWVLALPDPDAAAALVAGARGSGVLVTAVGRFVRLLPAATIVAGNLARACTILADEIARRNDRRHAGR